MSMERILIVVLYVIGIKFQLRSIKKQLEQRSKEAKPLSYWR